MRPILFVLLLTTLILLPGKSLAQTPTPVDEVTKTACVSTFAYPNLETLKTDVLAQAKRLAVNQLFGEFITAVSEVENFAVTSDQIRSLSTGFVRVRQEEYHNGPNLAEVCVTIIAFTTAEDRAKFAPVSIQKRNCVTDASMSVGQIRTYAQEEVLVQALIEYDRRLADIQRETLLRLLRRVVYSESGFAAGTDSYCAAAEGEVMPVEVLALLEMTGLDVPINPTPPPTATPTGTRLSASQPIVTPARSQKLSGPEMTATASMATVVAFQSRTATPTPTITPTPTYTATPNHTATAIQATAQAIGTMEAATATAVAQSSNATATAVMVTAQAIGTLEAATATAIAGVAQAIATAQAQGIDLADVRIGPVDGSIYVYVPEGEFLRGDDNGHDNEKPAQTIFVSAFWVKQTEVTNAEYRHCVTARACSAPENSQWQESQYADHPVTGVKWSQADAYAKWARGRLPTEAEWEKSCRGTDGRTYPWGNDKPDAKLTNFDDSTGGTKVVGSYPAGVSPYGALDMAGNVTEWTADFYAGSYYASAQASNPAGPTSGSYRVLRGSSYNNGTISLVRCAYRYWYSPSRQSDSYGFRVVMDVDIPPR
jgi:formylglycine-generating enzyme required for sulfatase activity